jgi:phospholipid-binding lipoprotein MlaA
VHLVFIMAAGVTMAVPAPRAGMPAALAVASAPIENGGLPAELASDDRSEIVVRARQRHGPTADPIAAVNEKTFYVAQDIDLAVVGPVAQAYTRFVPEPVRDGLHNVLNNLREPVVFVSFMLELKPGKAAETAGRFAINTIGGIGGLFDVARRKPINLPRRPNGFGDVLGYHGVGPGPYLFLPLIGPTTLRDLIAGGADRLLQPLAIGAPFNLPAYAIGAGAISAVDRRNRVDGDLETSRTADDPYVFRREMYLGQRRAEIEGLHHRNSRTGPAPDPSAGAAAPAFDPAAAATLVVSAPNAADDLLHASIP